MKQDQLAPTIHSRAFSEHDDIENFPIQTVCGTGSAGTGISKTEVQTNITPATAISVTNIFVSMSN